MGIEITENDLHYVNFLNTFLPPDQQIRYQEQRKAVPAASQQEQRKAVPTQSPQEQKKAAPASPSAKIGHAARRESEPAPSVKKIPPALYENDHEPGDDAIDSLISSLFTKDEETKGGK